MRNVAVLVCFGGFASFAIGQDSFPDPKTAYHLVSKSTNKLTATVELELKSRSGMVLFPLPGDSFNQKVARCEMYVESDRGKVSAVEMKENGPQKKPVLKVQFSGADQAKVVVRMDIDFKAIDLKEGKPESKPAMLPKADRARWTAPDWHYEHDTPGFRDWMKKKGLVRGKSERDLDYAYRVLEFVRSEFTYKKSNAPRLGKGNDLLEFIKDEAAECWGLSRIYACLMRSNGVPSRQVSGWIILPGIPNDERHHVRPEIWLDDLGWVHVEVAVATNQRKAPTRDFFAKGGDYMIVLNRGINYDLTAGKIGTFSGFLVFDGKQGSYQVGQWMLKAR